MLCVEHLGFGLKEGGRVRGVVKMLDAAQVCVEVEPGRSRQGEGRQRRVITDTHGKC